MSEDVAVRVSCVRHVYADRTQVDLCGLDFVVERGQRIVVLGPNGCGKSTLLYHILGLLVSQEGEVRVFGTDPAHHFNRIRERVGVLLQNVDEQIIAPTVWDDVSFSPRNYGYADREVDHMVDEALADVGITELRDKLCHRLSGGEKRKVALAGAIVLKPELLVMDEPFEGLDPRSKSDLAELLFRLHQKNGMTMVTATHDVHAVADLAALRQHIDLVGEISAKGTVEEIFADVARLKASNIEPPQIVELFQRLEDEGYRLGRPASVEEALARLKAALAARGRESA
jgi:cobalt/nickel transport system ATP-binding protein